MTPSEAAARRQEIEEAMIRARAAVRAREEAENPLRIGEVHVKAVRDPNLSSRSAFSVPPDFRVPSMPERRFRMSSSGQSFHFALTHVSLRGFPTRDGMPLQTPSGGSAVAHALYIEREEAVERTPDATRTEAEKDKQNEREDSEAARVEAQSARQTDLPGVLLANARRRKRRHKTRAKDAFNATEQDTQAGLNADAYIRDGEVEGGILSSISDDPDLRAHYWSQVEAHERRPVRHYLVPNPAVPEEAWRAILELEGVPALLRTHVESHLANPAPPDSRMPRVPDLPVTAEQAGEILQWLGQHRLWGEDFSVLEFRSGRGGRVQYRLVVELPAEMTPSQRALALRDFLSRSFDARALPYVAAIHAPTLENDQRNYHAHILFHDRPARLLENGVWDFAYMMIKRDARGRTRITYPFRQPKVAEVSQGSRRGSDNFVYRLRCEYAEVLNAHLARAGLALRYDPRSYRAAGIGAVPTAHLGPKAHQLEVAGVPTLIGIRNAYSAWDEVLRRIEEQREQREERHLERVRDYGVRARSGRLSAPERGRAQMLIAQYESDGLLALRLLADLQTLKALQARARSRAERTLQTTTRLLQTDGRHRRHSHTRLERIMARRRDALAHLESLDRLFVRDLQLIAGLETAHSALVARQAQAERALQEIIEAARGPGPARGRKRRPIQVIEVVATDPGVRAPSAEVSPDAARARAADATPADPVSGVGADAAPAHARDSEIGVAGPSTRPAQHAPVSAGSAIQLPLFTDEISREPVPAAPEASRAPSAGPEAGAAVSQAARSADPAYASMRPQARAGAAWPLDHAPDNPGAGTAEVPLGNRLSEAGSALPVPADPSAKPSKRSPRGQDTLLQQILAHRVPVIETPGRRLMVDRTHPAIAHLSGSLDSASAQAALRQILRYQTMEVQRVCKYIESLARRGLAKARADAPGRLDYAEAPRAIRTLLGYWDQHPAVQRAERAALKGLAGDHVSARVADLVLPSARPEVRALADALRARNAIGVHAAVDAILALPDRDAVVAGLPPALLAVVRETEDRLRLQRAPEKGLERVRTPHPES